MIDPATLRLKKEKKINKMEYSQPPGSRRTNRSDGDFPTGHSCRVKVAGLTSTNTFSVFTLEIRFWWTDGQAENMTRDIRMKIKKRSRSKIRDV